MSASGLTAGVRADKHKMNPRRAASLRGFDFLREPNEIFQDFLADAIIPQSGSHMQARNDKFPRDVAPGARAAEGGGPYGVERWVRLCL
jgi:hypothetical protein